MLWVRLTACAALLAASILAPSASHAAADAVHRGSSCGHPLTWHFSGKDFPSSESGLARGPVRAERIDPNGIPSITVSASRPWRICHFRGTYANGHTWDLPGTLGDAHHKSFAKRLYDRNQLNELVVSYAHRTSSDGSTCAAPRVVYDGSGGDAGGHIRSTSEGSQDHGRYVARWQLGDGSKLCFVRGWAFAGEPFTIRSGGDGSYPMEPFRSHDNHELPIAYLVLAFRR